MTLGELITVLEKADHNKVVSIGFNNAHSYRGNYSELAFEPAINITVDEMLKCAKEALGETFQGWKGGDYTMDEFTTVHLAVHGCCGEGIGSVLLAYMLGVGLDPNTMKISVER